MTIHRDPNRSVHGGEVDAAVASLHIEILASLAHSPMPSRAVLAERLRMTVPPSAVDVAVDRLLSRLSGMGKLDRFLEAVDVSEVMVNGDGGVYIERNGVIEGPLDRLSAAEVRLVVEQVVRPSGRRVDMSSPLVDGYLADGSRVNVVVPPAAVDGPVVTIRRFGRTAIGLDAFAPEPVAALLRAAVHARCNIVVAGGTGAGKTTLLGALAGEFEPDCRVITIEDAAELRLRAQHVVRLEAVPERGEGAPAIGTRTLLRNALRMRPDRIIVGECRGPEAFDMLQAMNTGHVGSLTTCHANGAAETLARIESMVLEAASGLDAPAVRRRIGAAIDLVVQVERTSGASRRVTGVWAVAPNGSSVARIDQEAPTGVEMGQRVLDAIAAVTRPTGITP